MKRQFDDEERKFTKRNLKKRKEELKDLLEALEMKKLLVNQVTPYNRRMEDKRNQIDLQLIKSKIEELKFNIQTTQKQLKGGINVKTPTGV